MTLVTSVDLNDVVYSSGVTAPNNMANRGWRTYFDPLLGDVLTEVTKELAGISSTSLAFGAGVKTLTTTPALALYLGGQAVIARASDPTSAWMFGDVVSRAGAALAVDVSEIAPNASGTFADWVVGLAAPQMEFAGGTATSVALVSSSDGLSITSGTITDVGTAAIALAGDMNAIESLVGSGFLDRLGTASYQQLTFSSLGKALVVNDTASGMLATMIARPTIVSTIITQTTTWARPNSCSMVVVELVGGGAGGAFYNGSNPGGGGGGAYLLRHFPASDISSLVTVTIADGGPGGTTSGGNGSNGGDTSFGSYAVAYGGVGGQSTGGGGGGGGLSVGSAGMGGSPVLSGFTDGFGGGVFGSAPKGTGFGGAAGAGSGTNVAAALFGGGGGAGGVNSGNSAFSGNGGLPGQGGAAPGGGGGKGIVSVGGGQGGHGARGEVRIYVL